METENKSKKSGKMVIIIAAAAVVVIAAVIALIWFSGKDGREIAKNLDLGNKYLTEQNYEEAIVAFNKVLEIDPMNVDAYLHLTEAYVAQAKAAEGADDLEGAVSFYNSAIEALKKGYDLTQNQSIGDKLAELQAEAERIQGIIDERKAEEARRKAEEAEIEAKQLEVEKKQAAIEEVVDMIQNDIKLLGLSFSEFKEMSKDEVASHAKQCSLGEIHEDEYSEGYYQYSLWSDWGSGAIHVYCMQDGRIDLKSYDSEHGVSVFWFCPGKEAGIEVDMDNVTIPVDCFPSSGTIEDVGAWFEEKGIHCEKNSLDGQSLYLKERIDGVVYEISPFAVNGKISLFFRVLY